MATEFKSEDADLESWIDDGVSFLQAEVKIYRDPGMFAKYQPLMQEIQILERELKPVRDKKERTLDEESLGGEQAATFTDESLGDETKSEVVQALEDARAEAQKLYDEYAANTEVWVIRRLNVEEVQALKDQIGDLPDQPQKPSSTKMSQADQRKALAKMQEWSKAVGEYKRELDTLCLQRAVVSITVNVKGTEKIVEGISLDGIERLKKRAGGDAHFQELVEAMTALSTEGVSIMAPHSPGAGA